MERYESCLETESDDRRHILQLIKALRDDEKMEWEEVSDILALPLPTVIHYWDVHGHLLPNVTPPK